MQKIRLLKHKILTKLLAFIQIFTKKEFYILVDDLFEEKAECIDAYSLFLYMRKNRIPAYYVVWEKNYFYKKLLKENKLDHVIVVRKRFGTDFIKRAFFPLLRTKVIVSAFLNWGDFSEDRKLVQDWICRDRYITHVFLNHGPTFFKRDVLNGYAPKWFDKLIVSNGLEKDIYIRNAGWTEKDIIKAGLPRWDLLKREQHEERVIFFMVTFRKTFSRHKNFKDFEYYKKIVSFFNNEILTSLLKVHNIKLLYGVHHAIYGQSSLDWKIDCKNVEIVDITNISRYIRRADLFITDYSSIVFDFMFLNIPVIFYKLDFKDKKLLAQDRVSIDKFDECAPYVYNCVDSEEELIEKIKHYIKTDFTLEKENIQKNNQFYYTRENIAQKLYIELEKL